MSAQSDIADILGKMTEGPKKTGGGSKLEQLLHHFSATGKPLSALADHRYLDRKVSTLKRYACRLSLKFPDYCPRHLKPKKAKAAA